MRPSTHFIAAAAAEASRWVPIAYWWDWNMETGSFPFPTLSLNLSRLPGCFRVLNRLISLHPPPLQPLAHDRLTLLSWFTLSTFLAASKLHKHCSCQHLCFLCPFNLCFSHLENPNHDSIQLFFPEYRCMHACTHSRNHSQSHWDNPATSQKSVSIQTHL